MSFIKIFAALVLAAVVTFSSGHIQAMIGGTESPTGDPGIEGNADN